MGCVAVPRVWTMPRMRAYLSRAGYRSLVSDVAPDILAAAKACYTEALEIVSPLAATADVRPDEPGLPLPEMLQGAASLTLMVCSLGIGIDREVEASFARGESLRALLLDAWASEAVEALVGNLDETLRRARGEGTMRFAPGYPPFDIRHNRNWLRHIKTRADCDIPAEADAETGIITPRKSIICAIGWKGQV